MKTLRTILFALLALGLAGGAYGLFMQGYVHAKFAPVPRRQAPDLSAPAAAWQAGGNPLFLHQVNTPGRARAKERKYPGFELDLSQDKQGRLYVAHDEKGLSKRVRLNDIFAALQRPQDKSWWIDLKFAPTEAQIDEILSVAAQYAIPAQQLLFEAGPGPTAQLLKKKNLGLLLQIPEGFEEDGGDPAHRQTLNAQALQEWQQYRPAAVAASFGKYPFLKAYFPNMPKAIYYSGTVRPSYKKPLMKRHMLKDPSVRIFMLDEYTLLPF